VAVDTPDIVTAQTTITTIADTILTGGLIVPIPTVITLTVIVPITGLYPYTMITGTTTFTAATLTDVTLLEDITITITDLTTGHGPVFI
jgi:hypothetical protein